MNLCVTFRVYSVAYIIKYIVINNFPILYQKHLKLKENILFIYRGFSGNLVICFKWL